MLRFSKSHNPAVFGSNPVSATEPLGSEPEIPRAYKCRPASKNVGLFAFHDTLPSVFLGFRFSNSPRIGTTLGQVPMICRQSCRILSPTSRRSRSLLGIGVIRRLRSRADWETNTRNSPCSLFSLLLIYSLRKWESIRESLLVPRGRCWMTKPWRPSENLPRDHP